MTIPASAAAPDRTNAFDALRALLAAGVLYSHTFLLAGGLGDEHFLVWSKGQTVVGHLAVLGFFGLSGFLVTASFERSRGVLDYLNKRVRRILPGLWVCLAVSAFVLAPAIFALRHGSLGGFHWTGGEDDASGFLLRNLAVDVRQWSIAGVLEGASYSESLNGSLWSLWPETLCYLLVVLLGAAGALGRNRILLLFGLAALAMLHATHTLLPNLSWPVLPTWLVLTDRARYFLAYLVGVALWLWRDRYVADRPATLIVLLVLASLARFGGLLLFAPLLVPLALVLAGQCVTIRLRHDLSYGLYIYGFPVQQLLGATALARQPWWVFFAASLALTGVFALLSWRFVERPFLRRAVSSA